MIIETLEEKEARIFNFHKKDLEKLGGMHGLTSLNMSVTSLILMRLRWQRL